MLGPNYSVVGYGNADGSVIERLDFTSSGDWVPGGEAAPGFYHDADADFDIDLADVASFAACFDPAGGQASPACLAAHDYDSAGVSDGNVDLDDFTALTGCYAGPYVTPGQDCARPSRSRAPPESGTYALHGRPVDVLSDGLVLVNYRARTYLPQHARFLQRDPTGYSDGNNLYEAFGSNPLTFLDPYGTEVIADVAALKFDELVARGWIDIYDTLAARGVDVYCKNYGCTHELCREVETLANALKIAWNGGAPDFVVLGERSLRASYQRQGKAGPELEALVSEVTERELYTLGGTLYHRMLHQFVRTDSRRIKRTQEELTKELLNFTLGMTMTPGMSIYGKARRAGSFLDDALSLSDDALGIAGRSSSRAGQTAKKIPAAKGVGRATKGGTYKLVDPRTGKVMRTGRTKNLARRQAEHARHADTKYLRFEIDKYTDSHAGQRGREQIIHDLFGPPMNKNRPIRPNHPRKQDYLDAAEQLGP